MPAPPVAPVETVTVPPLELVKPQLRDTGFDKLNPRVPLDARRLLVPRAGQWLPGNASSTFDCRGSGHREVTTFERV
jgi:hypothetical protein